MAKGKRVVPGRNVVPFRPRGGGLPPTGTANPWTARIIEAFGRTRDGFFEIGRLLCKAKRDLPHGEFINMIERELPFGRRYANMLMCVANDRRLGEHASHLPASGATLYELTKLDDEGKRLTEALLMQG